MHLVMEHDIQQRLVACYDEAELSEAAWIKRHGHTFAFYAVAIHIATLLLYIV